MGKRFWGIGNNDSKKVHCSNGDCDRIATFVVLEQVFCHGHARQKSLSAGVPFRIRGEVMNVHHKDV